MKSHCGTQTLHFMVAFAKWISRHAHVTFYHLKTNWQVIWTSFMTTNTNLSFWQVLGAVVIDVGLCYSYMLIAEKEHDRTPLTPFTFFFAKSKKMVENQVSWARSLQNWTIIDFFFGFFWIYNETEMPDTASLFFCDDVLLANFLF